MNKQSASSLKIQAGAEPFFFAGGKIGALCVHGLSASPQEVFWLGRYLAERGLTVFAPRLEGHGTHFVELHHANWQRWYYDVLNGYHLLRRQCDHIIALGMSMGGLLSLHLAAHEVLAGVVVMAAPLYISNPLWLAHLLRYVKPLVSQYDRETDPLHKRILDIQRKHGEPLTGRVAYYRHSAGGLAELHKLQRLVQAELGQVTAPALAIYAEKDATAPIGNLDRLARGLISVPRLDTIRLQRSGHIVTSDVECDLVFEAVWGFIQNIEVS